MTLADSTISTINKSAHALKSNSTEKISADNYIKGKLNAHRKTEVIMKEYVKSNALFNMICESIRPMNSNHLRNPDVDANADLSAFEDLPPSVRVGLLLIIFDAEVGNGGLYQFICNSAYELGEKLVHLFDELKLKTGSGKIQEALNMFPELKAEPFDWLNLQRSAVNQEDQLAELDEYFFDDAVRNEYLKLGLEYLLKQKAQENNEGR